VYICARQWIQADFGEAVSRANFFVNAEAQGIQMTEVRVRIAPSPTGDPHVGTAYIALFNHVFAKKHGGKFVLRIEDTDQQRAKASSEKQILSSLRWLGFSWDEGPDIGGPFGPYRQSERTAIYREHIDKLLHSGSAYRCFCNAERLNSVRQQQREQGLQPGYDRHCRNLGKDEVARLQQTGVAHVVRLAMPIDGTTCFRDELRGDVVIDNRQLDDQVLLKSDGYPTYHLANVVDDRLMRISHVIRAEEWISSTPKHVQLYRAFGWAEPKWVHMPLLRNADKSKISKRKNPVSIEYYRRAGILPGALVNFLGLMGWSYGDDIEQFTVAQMTEKFELSHIHLGGPVFDIAKLTWMNSLYMHKLTDQEFVDFVRNQIFSESYLKMLKPLVLERMSRFEQFVDNNNFFFSGALDYQGLEILPKGKTAGETREMLGKLVEVLDELYEWDSAHIKDTLDRFRESVQWKPKDFFLTLRMVLTGRKDSPPLVESIEVIGREMVRYRLRDCLSTPALSSHT